MYHRFYDSTSYKKKQSEKTKLAWRRGVHFKSISPLENRNCKRDGCQKIFRVKPYDVKVFCSQHCSALHGNLHRAPFTEEWKNRISRALIGTISKRKGKILVARLLRKCKRCDKEFKTERWKKHIYCSANCAIRNIGSRPTSPKAARAKSGIRPDISPDLYFFSRWEANFARIMNLLKIEWIFQPKTFDLKFQKYTPDFYLTEYGVYIEIKNFLADYSLKRDKGFRKLYPKEKLILILKPDYLKLQDDFSGYIKNWEFS